jgi:2-hydroxychromene-2-carboxylate isomerase
LDVEFVYDYRSPCAYLAARELGLFDGVHKAVFEAVWASAADLTTEEGRKSFFGAWHRGR